MNRVEQKKKARHLRSKAARHSKFIAAYVINKNKEIYDEAKKFYDELDKKYPGKRDLTKTDEFVHETTGYTIYQTYQINYQTRKNPLSNNQKDIALNIPLMNKDDVDLAVMSEKVNEEISIPELIYKGLLEEISNDPSMSNIFKDLNQEQTEELGEILEELDGILPEEKLPLEDELENIVYE